MALPTVQYSRGVAGTNSNLVSIWMPELQSLLYAAGWTIEAANADAIGTGSASVPAWDKAPVTSTSAGIAIYRMPANGFTRQWFIEFEPRWGGATAQTGVRIRVGTGVSGGVLTTTATFTANFLPSSGTSGLERLLSVSEDGFALQFCSSSAGTLIVVSVERVRSMAGVVGEDLVVQGHGPTATSGTLIGFSAGECLRYRASDGLEYAVGRYFCLTHPASNFSNFTASNASTMNMTDVNGEIGVPAGPFAGAGFFAGIPRLVFYLHPVNVVNDTDHSVFVDGASRLYRTPAVSYAGALMVPLLARE